MAISKTQLEQYENIVQTAFASEFGNKLIGYEGTAIEASNDMAFIPTPHALPVLDSGIHSVQTENNHWYSIWQILEPREVSPAMVQHISDDIVGFFRAWSHKLVISCTANVCILGTDGLYLFFVFKLDKKFSGDFDRYMMKWEKACGADYEDVKSGIENAAKKIFEQSSKNLYALAQQMSEDKAVFPIPDEEFRLQGIYGKPFSCRITTDGEIYSWAAWRYHEKYSIASAMHVLNLFRSIRDYLTMNYGGFISYHLQVTNHKPMVSYIIMPLLRFVKK